MVYVPSFFALFGISKQSKTFFLHRVLLNCAAKHDPHDCTFDRGSVRYWLMGSRDCRAGAAGGTIPPNPPVSALLSRKQISVLTGLKCRAKAHIHLITWRSAAPSRPSALLGGGFRTRRVGTAWLLPALAVRTILGRISNQSPAQEIRKLEFGEQRQPL